jgi:outer membrane protein OmpA-like peptidoglycan-associated protein
MILAWAAVAFAQDTETDIELVRPQFSKDGFLGVDTPGLDGNGTVRWSVLTQYERDLLIAYETTPVGGIQEVGAIVANRQALLLGVSTDFSDRFSVRAVLPLNAQWASDVPSLSGDGVGAGDANLGGRLLLVDHRRFDFAARADLFLPIGTNGAYMGEANPRVQSGFLAAVSVPGFTFYGDASLVGRTTVETAHDFTLGPELALNLGVRHPVFPGKADVLAALVTRSTLSTDFWNGGSENSSELLTGIDYFVKNDLKLDLGLGKGLSDGYGTSEFRAMLGLQLLHHPPPPAEHVITLPPELPVAAKKPPEDIPWEPNQLARVERSEIVIRDPIQFELNTARVLPESLPTLQAVAEIMIGHPEIGHLLIEGHASEEGSYEHNYELSNLRARSIYEELVKAGVHPKRMSTRGMGEVEPVALGEEEDRLALNRRVEFHILYYLQNQADVPQLQNQIVLPWNGEKETVQPQDKLPEQKPVTPDDSVDPSEFDEPDDTDPSEPSEPSP